MEIPRDHATHVAGTLIASGVNPLAKGMSNGLQELVVYDANNDAAEMMAEGPNLLLSNHSYGTIAGWSFNDAQNRWEFYGLSGRMKIINSDIIIPQLKFGTQLLIMPLIT